MSLPRLGNLWIVAFFRVECRDSLHVFNCWLRMVESFIFCCFRLSLMFYVSMISRVCTANPEVLKLATIDKVRRLLPSDHSGLLIIADTAAWHDLRMPGRLMPRRSNYGLSMVFLCLPQIWYRKCMQMHALSWYIMVCHHCDSWLFWPSKELWHLLFWDINHHSSSLSRKVQHSTSIHPQVLQYLHSHEDTSWLHSFIVLKYVGNINIW